MHVHKSEEHFERTQQTSLHLEAGAVDTILYQRRLALLTSAMYTFNLFQQSRGIT